MSQRRCKCTVFSSIFYFLLIEFSTIKSLLILCCLCLYFLCQIINIGRPLKSFGSAVLNIQWPNATNEGKRLLYLVQISDRGKNIIHCTPSEAINPLRFIKVILAWDIKLNNYQLLTSAPNVFTLQLSVLINDKSFRLIWLLAYCSLLRRRPEEGVN